MAKQEKQVERPSDLISKQHSETGLVQELPRAAWDLMGPELQKFQDVTDKPTELN